MSYIVVYQKNDGSSGIEECGDLDLAVVTAERLRNVDSVERPRIFKTEEIRYDFRPYYRVEVAGDDGEVSETVATSGLSGFASPVSETVAEASVSSLPTEPLTAPEPVENVFADEPAAVVEVADEPAAVVEVAEVADITAAAETEMPPPPEPVAASSGLFGRETAFSGSEVADEAAKSVDESIVDDLTPEIDVEPPRRGLFGR